MIYASYQQTPAVLSCRSKASRRNSGGVKQRKGNIISRLLNSVLPTGGSEKKQRLVLKRAGRKCFLFQSVLYPLVIKKRTRKKEGELLKSMKKVYPAPGAGCPLLMSFHKHFVHLSGWWGGWTAYWTAAWSLGQFLSGTSSSATCTTTPSVFFVFLCPHVVWHSGPRFRSFTKLT